jgi:hypothetical protein
VFVTVQRDRGARLEADQVEHRSLAEQRPAADARRQVERADVAEAHELRLCSALPIISLRRR